jgi:predicted PurR-regulated permease PerM
MQKFFKSRLMRSIVPYFILGVFLIIAFKIIAELGFFAEHFDRFWGVVTPFLIGGIVAYILNLPCSAIQKLFKKIRNPFVQKRSRGLSVITLFVLIVALLVFSFNLIIPAVSRSVTTFIDEFDSHVETFAGWVATVESWNLPEFLPDIDEEMIIGMVEEFIADMDTEGIASSIMAGFGAAGVVLFQTILVVVSSIYLLIEKDRLKGFAKRFIAAVTSSKTNEVVLKTTRKLNFNFHMYIYAQTIDGIILGSLMTGLLLIFRSPYALLLGIILGVVNYIPYFGSIFGTIFAVIVMALTQGVPTAALAAIFMFILQQADGNFIQPRLLGGSFSLSPLLVIISVTIGMAYGGVLGMLVAVPIVAILKDFLDEYIEYREEKKRNPPPPKEEDFMDRGVF